MFDDGDARVAATTNNKQEGRRKKCGTMGIRMMLMLMK